MGYCCRIFTPVQPVHPAALLRDFLSGAYMRASSANQQYIKQIGTTGVARKTQRVGGYGPRPHKSNSQWTNDRIVDHKPLRTARTWRMSILWPLSTAGPTLKSAPHARPGNL